MITIVAPKLPPTTLPVPQIGEAFSFNFHQAETYHCLMIEDGRALILNTVNNGWRMGAQVNLLSTWLNPTAQNRVRYTQVEITLKH